MNESEIVKTFSGKMLEKIQLRHDRYSPMGWKTLDIKRLLWLLRGELNELEAVYSEPKDEGNAFVENASRMNRGRNIQDEAIDIANYAMFIWELNKAK